MTLWHEALIDYLLIVLVFAYISWHDSLHKKWWHFIVAGFLWPFIYLGFITMPLWEKKDRA